MHNNFVDLFFMISNQYLVINHNQECLLKKKQITCHQPKLSTTSKQVFQFVSKTALSILNKTVSTLTKHQSQTNSDMCRRINIMLAQQNINFLLANSSFIVRRIHRVNQSHARFVATGTYAINASELIAIFKEKMNDNCTYYWRLKWNWRNLC